MKFDFKKLAVKLSERSYPIYIGTRMMIKPEIWWPDINPSKAFIICDDTTGELYAGLLQSVLKIDSAIYKVKPGEKSKSFHEYQNVSEWLLANGLNRQSMIFAVGGGVIGDLAGFAAATAMRGVKFIQVPTTLLAQVDSSVGGKTGINARAGKNMIGAFHQPQAVVIDTETLKTLPKREMLAGYAEIVKYGLLGNSRFFDWLESNGSKVIDGEEETLIYAIEKSCAMKAEIVRQDEFEETGLRATLNLGHTFAHALEAACQYDGRLLHGEAVAIGLTLAARLSAALKYITQTDAARVEAHLKSVGLATQIRDIRPGITQSAEDILALMRKDKKAANDGMVFVLLNKIGRARIERGVSEDIVLEIIKGSMT